ncbi:hypothetical protein [Hymenobacter sp. CRA2]|uniref:hypothetical protein n=1 Tax=Hymenobacter sp. CRA2 TaxID=1955620 RepID=UPI00098FE90D|nr:hypothetical protein [Hymenobacter sp. CRA2]OON67725.1 hypothetical protein B0919_16110 [Hymenobacter sp. CRA2]
MPATPASAPIRNTPNARTELTNRLKEFHRHVVKHTGREQMLKVYCNALCTWATDPNTDLYHVERLLDEIHHASALEDLDDWDDAESDTQA